MSRRRLLPSYLSQQAWVDLCDAIDVFFASRVDLPANSLRMLRRTHIINYIGRQKIADVQLLNPVTDLEVFEREVLLKQVNSAGLSISTPDYFNLQELARLFRNLPKYWYSKGTPAVADFLSCIFSIPITMKKLWTQDYVTFLPEGDAGIGTLLQNGGTWYPTSHVEIQVDAFTLPGGIPLELFAKLIEEMIDYPLVPRYVIQVPDIDIGTGDNEMFLRIGGFTYESEFIGNFAITGGDEIPFRGGGGFDNVLPVAIPGAGGTGYVAPVAPVADFTADVTSGAAPLTVTFTNTSTGYQTGYAWDFQNNGVVDSISMHPQYTFTTPGVYSVKLMIANHVGGSTLTRSSYITVT